MDEKKLFMMSPAEYQIFKVCCNPPALLVVRNGETPSWNRFVRAQAFWEAMGQLYGFDWETVEPCEGMNVAYFRATPLEAP